MLVLHYLICIYQGMPASTGDDSKSFHVCQDQLSMKKALLTDGGTLAEIGVRPGHACSWHAMGGGAWARFRVFQVGEHASTVQEPVHRLQTLPFHEDGANEGLHNISHHLLFHLCLLQQSFLW